MNKLYELKQQYNQLKLNKENKEYPLLCVELLTHSKVLSHAEIYHLLNEVVTYLPLHELNDEQKQSLQYCEKQLKQHKYYNK